MSSILCKWRWPRACIYLVDGSLSPCNHNWVVSLSSSPECQASVASIQTSLAPPPLIFPGCTWRDDGMTESMLPASALRWPPDAASGPECAYCTCHATFGLLFLQRCSWLSTGNGEVSQRTAKGFPLLEAMQPPHANDLQIVNYQHFVLNQRRDKINYYMLTG